MVLQSLTTGARPQAWDTDKTDDFGHSQQVLLATVPRGSWSGYRRPRDPPSWARAFLWSSWSLPPGA